MNDVRDKIAVMQAFADGKEIEVARKPNGVWHLAKPSTAFPLEWDWSRWDYRVKKEEPRRLWVNEYENFDGASTSKELAVERATAGAKRIAVLYIEAGEEE